MKQIEYISIEELTLLDKNPRKIDKIQFDKLCKNIAEDKGFFEARPCLVNAIITKWGRKQIVYAGNQRVRAAEKLGWKEVPCIVEEDIPESKQAKRVILDNLHHGKFDFDILSNEYEVADLFELGFTESQLGIDLKADITEIEEPKESKSKALKMCPQCGHEF